MFEGGEFSEPHNAGIYQEESAQDVEGGFVACAGSLNGDGVASGRRVDHALNIVEQLLVLGKHVAVVCEWVHPGSESDDLAESLNMDAVLVMKSGEVIDRLKQVFQRLFLVHPRQTAGSYIASLGGHNATRYVPPPAFFYSGSTRNLHKCFPNAIRDSLPDPGSRGRRGHKCLGGLQELGGSRPLVPEVLRQPAEEGWLHCGPLSMPLVY